MTNAIETTVDLASVARSEARAMRTLLGEGCSVDAVEVDGDWYVVTDGTGEGKFAYPIDDEDGLDLESGWVACEDDQRAERTRTNDDGEEIEERWDYSIWCSSSNVGPTDDLRVAIALYLADYGRISMGGTCRHVISDEQLKAIEIMQSLA